MYIHKYINVVIQFSRRAGCKETLTTCIVVGEKCLYKPGTGNVECNN